MRLSMIGFAFGEEQYQVVIDQNVAAWNDGAIVRYHAAAIRDVAALDVHSLGGPVVRIQTKSKTDGVVLLKGPLLDGVHQLGTDTLAAKRRNHIEVLDFRNAMLPEKGILTFAYEVPPPGKVISMQSEERNPLPGEIFLPAVFDIDARFADVVVCQANKDAVNVTGLHPADMNAERQDSSRSPGSSLP